MVVIPPIKPVILGIEFPTSVCSKAFELMAVRIGACHAATAQLGTFAPAVEMALDP